MKYNEKNQIVNTVPISRGILEHLERILSIYEFTVLIYLILRADFKTGACVTSSGDLSARIRLPQRTIRRILQTLSKEGYIKLFFESPNRTYPILINGYHTEKGDVDVHGTESIQNIQYRLPHSNTESTRRVTNNAPQITDDPTRWETSRDIGELIGFNGSQVLLNESIQMPERIAWNEPGHKLGNKEEDKQGDKSGDKQSLTGLAESRHLGNRKGDKQGDRLGDKSGTLLKKNKEIGKEEEKKEEIKGEGARFFDKSKNHSLFKKNSNKENNFFSYNGKWYKKSEFKVHDSGLLVDLQKNTFIDIPISFHDEPQRASIKKEQVNLQKYFIFKGSAYSKDKWVLDDDFFDLESSVRAKK